MESLKKKFRTFSLFGVKYSKEDTIVGWLFLLPAVVLGVTFVLLPMLISLSYAFTNAHLLSLDNVGFAGFDNFKTLFTQDAKALTALKNSLIFVVAVVPLQLGLALGIALLLNRQRKASTFFRWLFFSPVMLSLAVTSLLWMNLLNPETGLINALLNGVGIDSQGFLRDPKQALACIVFMSAWQGAGYQMLILLAGLKNIPNEVNEAATIDGANRAQILLRITLPLLKNTIGFVLVTMLIGAFKLIVQPMVITGGLGGPVDSTLTVSLYIYQRGITFYNVGYSSAIALIYTIIIAAVSLSLRKVFGEEKY